MAFDRIDHGLAADDLAYQIRFGWGGMSVPRLDLAGIPAQEIDEMKSILARQINRAMGAASCLGVESGWNMNGPPGGRAKRRQ